MLTMQWVVTAQAVLAARLAWMRLFVLDTTMPDSLL